MSGRRLGPWASVRAARQRYPGRVSITFAAVVFVTAMTAWTEDLLPSLVFAAALGVFLYLGVRPNGFLDRHDPPEQGTINWVWVGVIYVAAFIGMMAISLARPELYRRS